MSGCLKRLSILILLMLFPLVLAVAGTDYPFGTPGNYDVSYALSGSYIGGDSMFISGDLNGDGIEDFVTGSFDADNAMYVFFGSEDEKSGNFDLTEPDAYSVRIPTNYIDENSLQIGDVNGDGHGDLIFINISEKTVYVIFSTRFDDFGTTTGNTLDITDAADYNVKIAYPAASSEFGRGEPGPPIAVGDVTGDGNSDLVVVDASTFGVPTEAVLVWSSEFFAAYGLTTGNSASVATGDFTARFYYNSPGNMLSRVYVGDVNSDRDEDLVFVKRDGTPIALYVVYSTFLGDYSATTNNSFDLSQSTSYSVRIYASSGQYTKILNGGDFNNDASDDLLFGYFISGTTSIYVFTSDTLDDYTGVGNDIDLLSGAPYDYKFTVTTSQYDLMEYGALVDLTGDARDDLILSHYNSSAGGLSGAGAVYFLSGTLLDSIVEGSTTNLNDSDNYSALIYGPHEGSYLTWEANYRPGVLIGDTEGDGNDDLILSGQWVGYAGYDYAGAVYVLDNVLLAQHEEAVGVSMGLSDSDNYTRAFFGNILPQVDYNGITQDGTIVLADWNDDGVEDLFIGDPSQDIFYVVYSEIPLPTVPTIGTPTPLSTTSIRWNFTDNSSNETGFKVYNESDTLMVTCAEAGISYCDETGLSINTQYTRKVVAYNDGGNSPFSDTANVYTLANVPGFPTLTATTETTMQLVLDVNGNPAATEFLIYNQDSAQYLQLDGTLSASSVWGTYSDWGSSNGVSISGLNVFSEYTFLVKAQNGDGVETSYSGSSLEQTLDSGAPKLLKLGVRESKLYNVDDRKFATNQSRVKLYFDVKDNASEVGYIKISEHSDFKGASWKRYDGDSWINLSSGDEKKRLHIKLKDNSGNESDVYEQLILLDTKNLDLTITQIGTFEPDFEKYKNYFYTEENPLIQGYAEEESMILMYVDGKEAFRVSEVDREHGFTCEEEDGPDKCYFITRPNALTWGKHELELMSEDAAGNQSSVEFNITLTSDSASLPINLQPETTE